MTRKIKQRKIKGQSALEMGIAISLTLVIVMATVRVWGWGTSTMRNRYLLYQGTRPFAVGDIENDMFGKLMPGGNNPFGINPLKLTQE